jgi:pyruvyl transferase EpsO
MIVENLIKSEEVRRVAADRMTRLSSALDICAPLLDGPIILLDYPVHGNIGDLLIWLGEIEFFKRHGKQLLGQYNIDNIGKRARSMLEECSTICFHGGGNLGDLWPRHQKFREQVIREYPNKRIVIFPQSVYFGDRQELDKACTILKKHPDLHIFLRDKNSLSLLQDKRLPNLVLCPDMAHALWKKTHAPSSTQTTSLYLLRRDKESANLLPEIESMRTDSSDWEDILTGWTRRAYLFGLRINEIDSEKVNDLIPVFYIWRTVSNIMVNRAIDLFAPHTTIVTNRLHAVILATLLGRQVFAYDNSYGKISSYVDCWMSDFPGVTMKTARSDLCQ